jgi:hypothetical protein
MPRRAIPRPNYSKVFLDTLRRTLEMGRDEVHNAITPNAYKSKEPPVEVIFQTAKGSYHAIVDPGDIRRDGWRWAGRSIGAVACMGYGIALRRRQSAKRWNWGATSYEEWVFVKRPAPEDGKVRVWQWMKEVQ